MYLVIVSALLLPAFAFAQTAPTFGINHQLWDHGPDILALQQWLNTNGYIVAQIGAGSPGEETDVFGPHTYRALLKFQAAHDLPQTGYFGPLTRAAIASAGGSSSSATQVSRTSSGINSPASSTASTSSQYIPGVTPLPGYAPGEIIAGGGGSNNSNNGGGGGNSTPTTDTTPPSVSLTAPSSGATLFGSSVTLTATASDNVTVANVQFKVDGTNIGSAVTSSPYTTTWNSTGVSDGSHTLYAVAEDTSGNYATSSESVTVENTPVSIFSISSGSPTTTSATITWTTNENASSTVLYGLTTGYGNASSSVSFLTLHSIILSGLTASTTYHFQVQATNAAGNYATSSDQTFTTGAVPDTTPPTTPTNLTAVASSSTEVDLSWTASTDNVGVVGYKILRGGVYVGTTTLGTTYADTGLTASTTYTYTVQAYDAAGNVSPSSNTATSTTGTWQDGFAGAPSGTAQYPNLLQGYGARAPWRVAGVDYPVGIPSGTSLSDPYPGGSVAPALVALGCAYNDSQFPLMICSGVNNITISGYDFTLHGGISLLLQGNNATVKNSKFNSVSYTGFIDVEGAGVTVENNEFTLAYGGAGALYYRGSGSAPVVFEYNYMHDMYGDAVGINGSASSVTIKYNVVYNMANWPSSTNGSGLTNHFNDFSLQGSSSTINNLAISFNTLVQFPTGGNGNSSTPQGGEFAQFYDNVSSSTLNNASFNNNTLIAEGGVNPLAVARQNNTAYPVGTLLTVPGSADLLYMVYYAGTSGSTVPTAYSSTGVGTEFADGSGGMIVSGGNNLSVSYFLHGSNDAGHPTLATGTLTLQNNYYGGLTNAYGVYYPGTWGTSNPPSGSSAWTASGNLSMDDGSPQNTLP